MFNVISSPFFVMIALFDNVFSSGATAKISRLEIPDSPADHGITGWKGIMAGVLWQAKHEAEIGDKDARAWLKSDDCADYCQAVNYNHNLVLDWEKKNIKNKKGSNMSILDENFKLKQKVAGTLGLPGIAIEWLRGDTEEEIKADAEKLVRFMNMEKLPKSINEMTPSEVCANAKDLLKKENDAYKAFVQSGYKNLKKPE